MRGVKYDALKTLVRQPKPKWIEFELLCPTGGLSVRLNNIVGGVPLKREIVAMPTGVNACAETVARHLHSPHWPSILAAERAIINQAFEGRQEYQIAPRKSQIHRISARKNMRLFD